MPTYKVTIAGKTYNVDIAALDERPVRATVDGEEVLVEVTQEAVMTATPAPPVVASAPQSSASPRPSASKKKPTPSSGQAGDITAPLPGTVVNIGVSEGDTVERGQELCVIEAMKMNNPIRAGNAGTVEAIYVHIGQQIQHGAPLIRIGA